MISGVVNAEREAIIPLIVRGVGGRERAIDAVVDTGFTGSLTLPSRIVSSLGLPWRGREPCELGDGTLQFFDVYAASVIWDGNPRLVEVDVAETEPLLGMELICGHDLHIRAVQGGRVTIDPIP